MKRTKRPQTKLLQQYQERQRKKWTKRYGKPYPTATEERYRRGDSAVLLQELMYCLIKREPLPEWLRKALIMAIARGHMSCEFDSWDKVFGAPVQTEEYRPARGKSRDAEWRRRRLQFEIYNRVMQREAKGEAISKGLFEDVAKALKIGRARAERLYYDNRAIVEAATEATCDRPATRK